MDTQEIKDKITDIILDATNEIKHILKDYDDEFILNILNEIKPILKDAEKSIVGYRRLYEKDRIEKN